MHYVYILYSGKDGRQYTGFTPDLRARLKKHQLGYVLATRHRRPLKLIHYEAFLESADAKRRKQYLKGGKGRAEMRIMLENTFRKIDYEYR